MIKHLNKLYETNDASLEELTYILDNLDEDSKNHLFSLSLKTKEKHYSDLVFMRGLIEISNYCKQNCAYCGIRKDNKDADRYRLDKTAILSCCKIGYDLGYRTYVIQGGEDNYYTDEVLIDIVTTIKSNYPECAITLSLGERTYESYEALYKAGADRYLLRHETANKELYESIHPDMSFENRRKCHQYLKEIGFQVGAGCMVGLPNQTNRDLALDLRYLKELEPEMVGIGPFIPHKKTPLGDYKGGTVEETLIMLALARLLLPTLLLPSTTALGTLDGQGREKALKVGGNVVMPNLSPIEHREKYELYEDKICTGDEAAHCRKCIEGRINSAGFKVDMSRGDHVNWKRGK